MDHVTLYG